jgi:hypothetical protein
MEESSVFHLPMHRKTEEPCLVFPTVCQIGEGPYGARTPEFCSSWALPLKRFMPIPPHWGDLYAECRAIVLHSWY